MLLREPRPFCYPHDADMHRLRAVEASAIAFARDRTSASGRSDGTSRPLQCDRVRCAALLPLSQTSNEAEYLQLRTGSQIATKPGRLLPIGAL